MTIWVVAPGWGGSGIPLRDDRDHAAALSARGTKEPFDVWEEGANRPVGSFRCGGIDGDEMSVIPA